MRQHHQCLDTYALDLLRRGGLCAQVYCADGSAPLTQLGLVPGKMLCPYQDPHCLGVEGDIQCPSP